MATESIRAEREDCNSGKKDEEDEASSTAVAAAATEEEEEDEEEEALSLCDLPDKSNNKEEDQEQAARKEDSSTHQVMEEEFDFLLWGGPFSKESKMCVADEVFFQGQILPLCKYFTSADDDASRLLPTGFNRSESSRSGSMTSEFRSSNSSSRSSSIRSQNSSTSINSTNPEISKPRTRNQFQMHPNPKPQPKVSNSRQVSFGHHLNRKSSSAWDFFRLGVAPAPEIIGLQDLKVRCTNNKNKTSSVGRNSSNSSSDDRRRSNTNNHNGFRQILRGCKCSVETIPFDIMITKRPKKTESTRHAMKEKAKQKQRKKAMSRHRTFEWIKELSHATSYGYNDDDEQALLPNS